MNEAAPIPEPDAEWAADLLHHRAQLREMADQAAALVRLAVEQAQAGELPVVDASVVVERASRSARRCMLLAHRLGEPVAAGRASAGAARVAARRRILREVEDSIAVGAEASDVERLRGELLERLDAPELEDDIAARPVGEIIADIRRDLGLVWRLDPFYRNRRTPGEVAVLCARAGAPAGGPAGWPVGGHVDGPVGGPAVGLATLGIGPDGQMKDGSSRDAALARLLFGEGPAWGEDGAGSEVTLE